MFKQEEWSFTGASGTTYSFSMVPKSGDLPEEAGVYVLAYTHPRGHLAGWQVNPLFIGQSGNMRAVPEAKALLDREQRFLWNSTFVLAEPEAEVRERCVRDLKLQDSQSAWRG